MGRSIQPKKPLKCKVRAFPGLPVTRALVAKLTCGAQNLEYAKIAMGGVDNGSISHTVV